jgi:hypothetical protein
VRAKIKSKRLSRGGAPPADADEEEVDGEGCRALAEGQQNKAIQKQLN